MEIPANLAKIFQKIFAQIKSPAPRENKCAEGALLLTLTKATPTLLSPRIFPEGPKVLGQPGDDRTLAI